MLTKIFAFHQSIKVSPKQTIPSLSLPQDTYEDYLAFLFQNNEEFATDNHLVYLQKAAFDAILQNFSDNDLGLLAEKEDLYMCYIMYITLKCTGNISEEQFTQNIGEMFEFYQLTCEEMILVDRIQVIVKTTLKNQTSPYSYLAVCNDLFSEKLQIKLIDILKFLIGDSACYKMSPASVFGICLKWVTERYGIKNPAMNQLVGFLIDLNDQEIQTKIQKITQTMNQILNMESSQ